MTNLNPKAATLNTLLEALHLASLGYRIVPIKPGEKYPALKAWQDHASTDPEIITNWLTGLYQDHGIGIAPGPFDGRHLFVIDIDEHGVSGTDTLNELEDTYGDLPATVTTLTGSGGKHLYYLSPTEVRNDQAGKIGPGIDIRGTGGQVLAPPTIHPNGQPYVWEIGFSPDDITPAQAPKWLLALITPKPTPPPVTERSTTVWDELDDSPAARYNHNTTWTDLLTADGWQHDYTDRNGEQHWTRPGKQTGTSATVNWQGKDILKVFTSSIDWLPEGAYTRFGYTACRHHNGNRSDFAKTLIEKPSTAAPMIAVNPTEPWPDPIQLITPTQTPDFPTHTLPTWITNQTQQIARNIQVAHDLPASLALGALSVIALGNTKIRYERNNWNQPLNLYIAIALPPSAGKTPAKNAIFWPLEQIELQRMAEAKETKDFNDSTRRIYEKELKTIEEKVTKNPDNIGNNQDERRHIIQKINDLPKSTTGRLLVDDTTTEALGVTLSENNGHIALISAEGGLFDRIAGMYSDGTANLDLFLEAWSGGRYIVDRIKRDSIQIPSANIVITTTIQPQTLAELGARKQFAGRGFTARFLIAKPSTNVGQRDRLKTTHTDEQTENLYNHKITELARKHYGTNTQLGISQPASDHYAQWDQQLENQLGEGQPLEHLAEWVGKLRSNALRIAALLHIAHEQPGDDIELHIMKQALQIADYYLTHMLAISDEWGTDETTSKTLKIVKWMKRTKPDRITIRDIMRHNRRIINTSEETLPIIQLLVDKTYLRPLFDGPVMPGQRGKASQEFAVNPKIYIDSEMSPMSRNLEPVDKVVTHVAHISDNLPQNYTDNTVNDVKLSRMSRMSPKGGFETTSSSSKITTSPPTPGDMGDMGDNLPNLDNLI